MPLIATVSGIRGVFGDGLDPAALVRYASAFGAYLREQSDGATPLVVVGRDGRVTGDVCARIVTATLQSSGCDVVDGGLATTPTVAMGVLKHGAAGAVILSASHNPAEWNALKLLGPTSRFLDATEGARVLALAEAGAAAHTVGIDALGGYRTDDLLPFHIDAILALPLVDREAIAARGFRVVVDAVNSVGAVAFPPLLDALGVAYEVLNADVSGRFAHNPEPLPEHLGQITARVAETGADLGIVVDPDADRLAFVEDGGRFFGEELTQVVAADYVLSRTPGPVGTNLSSSRALDDVAARYGVPSVRSAVGEIHVVQAMAAAGAVIGGEGNGGVIYPALHEGRDALVGTALVLSHLARSGRRLSDLRADLPAYHMAKQKVALEPGMDARALLAALAARYADDSEARVSTEDGVKVDLPEGWAHVRASNTEPILRVYTEAATAEAARSLAHRFRAELLPAGAERAAA